MAITDYKVTDAERNAVYVQAQADTLSGTAAQNKAVFDAYPELVRDNLDDLIDYIDVKPMSFESTVSAATANKGSFSGWIPTGAIIDLVMTNGNTAVSPTITIDSVTYTISGMPTVAKMSASTAQAYKLKKTGATALAFVSLPDYVCEYGTTGNICYHRNASGEAGMFMTSSSTTGTLTMTEVTSGVPFYESNTQTLTLPTGLFSAVNYTARASLFHSTYVIGFAESYSASTATSLAFQVFKAGSSSSDVSYRYTITGRWF